MKNHKDLLVWQKSIALVKELYVETASFPKEEIYGITSQIRRAAVSIPSNISEGYGRGHDREIIHFLYIALGSASEVETQIILCKEVGLMSVSRYDYFNREYNRNYPYAFVAYQQTSTIGKSDVVPHGPCQLVNSLTC